MAGTGVQVESHLPADHQGTHCLPLLVQPSRTGVHQGLQGAAIQDSFRPLGCLWPGKSTPEDALRMETPLVQQLWV